MLREYIGWEYEVTETLPHGWTVMNEYPPQYSYRIDHNISIIDQEDKILTALHKVHQPLNTLVLFNAFKIGDMLFHCRERAKFENDSRWIQFKYHDLIMCGELLLAFHNVNKTQYCVLVEMSMKHFDGHKMSGDLNEEKRIVIVQISDIVDQCVYVEGSDTYSLFPLHSYFYDVPFLSNEERVPPDNLYQNDIYRHRV